MNWNKENIFSAPARKLQMPKAGLLLQHNLPKGAWTDFDESSS